MEVPVSETIYYVYRDDKHQTQNSLMWPHENKTKWLRKLDFLLET